MSHEQTSFLPDPEPPAAARDLPAGWKLHPSTRTAHYFPVGSRDSLCKREHRGTGPVEAEPGVFPCTLCNRRLLAPAIEG